MENLPLGFALLALGAICGGSFGLPSKFVKSDLPWENLWGPFFLFVTIILPVALGPVLVNDLYGIYRTAGWGAVLLPLVFGLLWGLGSMTLGLSFAFIGLSLAYAINYGGQIIVGAMGPMLIHHPETVGLPHGQVIVAGVVVCLIGVVVCGRAGILKTRQLEGTAAAASGPGKGMLLGLFMAFLSGVLCACWSIAFSFGNKVIEIAQNPSLGNQAWQISIPVTILILWGGSVSACLYCFYKLWKNNTWHRFRGPGAGAAVALALVMALLHDGAVVLFGLGATYLGPLGGSVGYAAFMSLAIITGNVNGFLTGEWKGAGQKSVAWICAGILVLIAGVCVLAKGNAMSAAAAEKPVEELRVES